MSSGCVAVRISTSATRLGSFSALRLLLLSDSSHLDLRSRILVNSWLVIIFAVIHHGLGFLHELTLAFILELGALRFQRLFKLCVQAPDRQVSGLEQLFVFQQLRGKLRVGCGQAVLDCMVSDVQMPEVCGIELFGLTRERPRSS